MKKARVYSTALLLCMIFGALFVSCSSECTGEITEGGKTYTAKAMSSVNAVRFACNKYCLDADAKCEAMYGIWVNSPEGKAAGSPPKTRSLSKSKELLDCITIECADRCIADAGTGKIQNKVNCK